jgi:CheY-like chemotaxis protein/tetratricopeptide (TPR) repeat protein
LPTVLIVDDDKFTRTVLETIFAQDEAFANLELEILTAGDGDEGLRVYREHHPDVVIVDLLMPRVDGFAMCKALRAEPEGRDLEIVVMSGIYRDNAVKSRLQAEYSVEFFAKPYQLKEMTQHVAALLGGATTTAASATPTPPPPPTPLPEPATPAPVGTGEFIMRPLPAVLFDLLEQSATGQLNLRRGRISKTVDVVVGHPTSVSSTARDETLGHFLVARGAISDQQHKDAIKHAADHSARVGDALIAMELLTPERLVEELTAQTRHKVVQSLRWPDGAWRFEPNDFAGNTPGHAIDVVQMVFSGLRETATFNTIPERVASIETEPLELTDRGKRLLPSIRAFLSDRFVESWTEGVTIESLLAKGVDRRELFTTLEALLMCDALNAKLPALGPGLAGGAPNRDESYPEISVQELSEHSQISRLPPKPPEPAPTEELYAMLFDTTDVPPLDDGDLPLDEGDVDGVPEAAADGDSGYIDVRDINADMAKSPSSGSHDTESRSARRMLLREYVRIQGLDHYAVLQVDADADAATISAAITQCRSKYSLDWFARFDLGRDYSKLEEIHAAFDRAFDTLLDDVKRREYDTERAGGDLTESAPSLAAEIAFRAGEEMLAREQFPPAIKKFEEAIAAAANEADYHAALGWAHYLSGKRGPMAADAARPHLNQALSINPDHAVAHQYKGMITSELGNDDVEATFHLERALEADPNLVDALRCLEDVWNRRGEARPLERQYRRMIYRVAGRESKIELRMWMKLAELYRTRLDDVESARIAYASAERLAPGDSNIQAAIADLDSGTADRFFERSEMLRSHWERDPSNSGPGLELMRAAAQAQRHDAAYMAASALVARDMATDEANTMYQRFRPRFVVRAQRQLEAELWNRVCHPDDLNEIGALMELIAPAIRAATPMDLADLEVDEAMEIPDEDLPPAFLKVRAYVAHVLGLHQPRVFVRPDFGRQVHVGAVDPPVLLAGDDALASPERSELTFRLGRAMTYLWPGRAIGGSRPSRLLKAATLAVFSEAVPGSSLPDTDSSIAEMRAALAQLDATSLDHAKRVVMHITGRSRSLNLSQWVRALARTADRVGLLLCGDLPSAARFAEDSGGLAATEELVDFSISSAHLTLRQQMGLSIDV